MRALGIGLIALGMALAGFYASFLYFDEPLPASRLSEGGVKVGSQRPDFTLGSIRGETVSAADFDGRVVLYNFWATWCEPCRREMPMLMDLQAQYGQQGLQVVGVAVDEVENASAFVAEYGISYPNLAGITDVMKVNLEYGNVEGVLPYSVLVDRDGVIRWQYIGEIPHTAITTLLENYL